MWLIFTVVAILSVSANSLLVFKETRIVPSRTIEFPFTQTCLNILNFQTTFESNHKIDEILKMWYPKSVTIINTNSTKIIPQLTCKLFIIFYEYTIERLQQINFQPFTQILIISKKLLNVKNLQNFYFKKSINILAMLDTGERYNLNEFLNENRFIDQLLRNDGGIINLRASFFHCPPFVIISNGMDGKVHYEGIEMKCLLEIAGNWNLSYVDTTKSAMISDLWETTLLDVGKNISDVAMCSVWQNEAHAALYDLSSYISIQCVTVLVPNPSAITQALIIYLPFQREVWILFILTMLLTAVLIRFATRIEFKVHSNRTDRKYAEFGRVLFDIISISTSHGLFRFPNRLIIKIFFFGWTITMLLFDTAYSTGYTSIMTIPQYSKSIDTVKDFLDAGLHWSESSLNSRVRDDIRNTGSPDFIRFADGLVQEDNLQHRMKMLANKKIGKLTKVLSNKFLTELDNVGEYASTMQPMKECLFNYYTVFAFRKNSPYKKIFDRQISRIKAAGLFDSWFDSLISRHFNESLMAQILERHTEQKNEPTKLKIDHLIGGFYLLFAGLSLSTSVFCVELLCKNFVRNSGSKIDKVNDPINRERKISKHKNRIR